MIKVVLTLLLLIFATGNSRAQKLKTDMMAYGRNYVIAFPEPVRTGTDPRHPLPGVTRLMIYMYSPVENRARIIRNGKASQEKTLQAGKFEIVEISAQELLVPNDHDSKDAVGIETRHPVVVYCYLATDYGYEAWAPLPVEAWGNEYDIAAIRNGTLSSYEHASASFVPEATGADILIVAAYDNTIVQVIPNDSTYNIAGVVYLNANQAHLIRDVYRPSRDLGGSGLVANKPIGVMSGNCRTTGDPGPLILEGRFGNMLLEAIPPVRALGTEFVYLPTWDDARPTGVPSQSLEKKRLWEIIRLYGASDSNETFGTYIGTTGDTIPFTIPMRRDRGEPNFFQLVDPYPHYPYYPQALYFRTDRPTLAVKNSTAVAWTTSHWPPSPVPPPDTIIIEAAPYMTEMVPREQWVASAPFFTPHARDSMKHYINVVTTRQHATGITYRKLTGGAKSIPFPMNTGTVPGTDFVWGSVDLDPGSTYMIEGTTEEVRFYGTVYGSSKGFEIFRRRGDSGEYNLRPARAYGYPLAPHRTFLKGSNDFVVAVDTVDSCRCTLMLSGEMRSVDGAGFRSVDFENAVNTTAYFYDYMLPHDHWKVAINPENPTEEASGILVVTDKTGFQLRVPYSVAGEHVEIRQKEGIDFGERKGGDIVDTLLRICNMGRCPVTINHAGFGFYDHGFSMRYEGTLPIGIAAGACIDLPVRLTTRGTITSYIDTMYLATGCGTNSYRIPMSATATWTTDAPTTGSAQGYDLSTASPNPFSSHTDITIRLAAAGHTFVGIHDEGGRLVEKLADGTMDAGEHRIRWNAAEHPSGTYYCRVTSGSWSAARQLTLVR